MAACSRAGGFSKKIESPFYRTTLEVPISNLTNCGSSGSGNNYRLCFKNSSGLDQTDNLVESLFYDGVPLYANLHRYDFDNASSVQSYTNNYTNPAHFFMNLFKFNDSHVYDWTKSQFVGLNDVGSNTASIAQWLSNAYQYFRADPTNQDLRYGINEDVLHRYQAAIVAIEPGDEVNSFAPGMRTNDSAERQNDESDEYWFFTHFCQYAKSNGKYCVMASMSDGITTNDASGEPTALEELTKYADVVGMADFANFHLYLDPCMVVLHMTNISRSY